MSRKNHNFAKRKSQTTYIMENYNIVIPKTKEGRVSQMRDMINRAILVKKEMHEYYKEHKTTEGFKPNFK